MCELQRMIGFQKGVKNGIVFSKHSTLFYLAGQIGIFHSLEDDIQKFIYINEKNECTAMALGGKQLLAVASKTVTPKISIHNLKSTEKHVLSNPKSFTSSEYVCLSFSKDSEYLAAQGDSPSWPFVMWQLEKRSIATILYPFRLELGTKVFKFVFDPESFTNVVAVGRYFLRIYQYRNGLRFREDIFHELERSQKTFHSLTWIQNSNKFAVGTSDGIILVFQGKRLLQQIFVQKKLAEIPRVLNKISNPENKNIACLLSTKTGIICSYGGNSVLCLHWKVDENDFNIVVSVHNPKRVECIIEDSKIVQLAVNSNEDRIVAATVDGQVLTFSFAVPGLLGSLGYEADFDAISDQQHTTPVIHADTAANKAVHATCSSSTVILWDYQKRQLLLWKKFESEIYSVAVHQLGIHIVIGFKEGAKMYNILYDKLEEIKQFDSKDNLQICFSDGGHMIAIGNASCIDLYSSLSFEKITEFEKHEGKVKFILWKNCGNRLLSLDEAGKIYEWDIALKKKIWLYSATLAAFSTLTTLNDNIYAATSDSKIWVFEDYQKTTEIDTRKNVTSLVATKQILFVGNECGVISGYSLTLNQIMLFETYCHKGRIINMTVKENGKLLMVTGEDSAISMWKIDVETGASPLFDEVLIERKLFEEKMNAISELEEELKLRKTAAESKRSKQRQVQETEISELGKKYEDIQNQLKQKILILTQEKNDLKIEREKSHLDEIKALSEDRQENYADFQTKIGKEQDHFKKLIEERSKKVNSYEWQLYNLKEEIQRSNESLQLMKAKNEKRLQELEHLLQKELEARNEIMKFDEKFYKNLEDEDKVLSEEKNFEFASDLQKARKQNQILISDVERLSAELSYEKECNRALDAEFEKKQQTYDGLVKIIEHIKNRISHMNSEIQRKESVLEDKVAMIKVLEDDVEETEHLNSEANRKLNDCKKLLEEKYQELVKISVERKQLENEQRHFSRKLKNQQREKFMLEEKLKSTERSISDNIQKTIRVQLLLERYKKEFTEATKDVDTTTTLRWNLLKLFDKRVLRGSIKEEEVFVEDMDPFTKFCRQRDHYESLINTVLNRKQEIETAFRSTYVNLAKENSDWMAFVEALRSEVKLKQDRIRILEMAVGLPAKDFSKDPAETQRCFNDVYESLKIIEQQGNEEIKKRMNLIEAQTKELQRLHGLLVVDEKGKIFRKTNQ